MESENEIKEIQRIYKVHHPHLSSHHIPSLNSYQDVVIQVTTREKVGGPNIEEAIKGWIKSAYYFKCNADTAAGRIVLHTFLESEHEAPVVVFLRQGIVVECCESTDEIIGFINDPPVEIYGEVR